MPARIAEAGNTQHRYALGALASRGFTVVIRPDTSQDDYWAIHPDGTRLIGSSPLVLLGLLSLLDQLGEDWYNAPKVQLPKGRILDLTPEGMARMPDSERAAAAEALELLGRITAATFEQA